MMKRKSALSKKNQLASFALTANEALDPTFGANGIVTADFGGDSDSGRSVLIQPDGKIVMLGTAQGQTPVLMRFNSNGSVDDTFGVDGKLAVNFQDEVALQLDGKLIVGDTSGGSLAVARYLSNGAGLDTTFGTNGVAKIPSNPGDFIYLCSDLAVQPDHKIVLVGTQESQGHTTNIIVARFTSEGAPDTTFAGNGLNFLDKYAFPNSAYFRGEAVAIQPDGKIVLSANMFDNDTLDEQIGLARLKPDGSLDTSAFGTNGKGTVAITLRKFNNSRGGLALQADGKIVVLGNISNYGSNPNDDLVLARFNTDGSLDPAFGENGIVVTDFGKEENGNDIAVQPDGKILVVGKTFDAEVSDILLVRYDSDGSLDDTFGLNGKVITDLGNAPDSGNGIAIQTDGKLVIVGSSNGNAILARYITDISNKPKVTVTFRSTGGRDGWILESAENSNRGGKLDRVATTIKVGDDQKNRQYRGILSFNTFSIPDNAIVTAAELRIKRQSIVGNDPFTSHGDLLVDIKNSAFGGNLKLVLSDFEAPADGQDRIPATSSSWYSAKLKAENLGFISKVGVTQFRLRFAKDDDDDLSADYIKFFSGNASDADRPMLIVTYFVP
jgi:uncharacterized delta-60 repeat protein